MDANKSRVIVSIHTNDLGNFVSQTSNLSDSRVGTKFFKVGPALLVKTSFSDVAKAVRYLDARLFADLELHSAPHVVRSTVRELARNGAWAVSVHCSGGINMMKAAAQGAKEGSSEALNSGVRSSTNQKTLVLGVTLLSSMEFEDLYNTAADGTDNIQESVAEKTQLHEQIVEQLALSAQRSNLDGVIIPPLDIKKVRSVCGGDFKIITPGMRMTKVSIDTQKRVCTPLQAIHAGADRLLIGKLITSQTFRPQGIHSSREVLQCINRDIEKYFSLSPEMLKKAKQPI